MKCVIPEVSAGSNQVGASDTWMPQISWPCGPLVGPAAPAVAGAPAASPRAVAASRSRRLMPKGSPARAARSRRCTKSLMVPPSDGPVRLGRRAAGPHRLPLLWVLERDVLVGRGVGVAGDQAEPRLADPRPDAVEKAEQPDRRIDRPLVDQLLHLLQDRRALFAIKLDCLLLEHRVDVGVAAIGVGAALDVKRLEPRRRVAERAAAAIDDVLQALLGIGPEKGGALERPQPAADADFGRIVQQR